MQDTTTNFQSLATRTGADFHSTCCLVLEKAGWEIAEMKLVVEDVIEIDAIANNRHGIAFPFEFKGGYGDDRAGMIRTDNVLKALGTAVLFSTCSISSTMAPMLVLTTAYPSRNRSLAMLRRIPSKWILDVLVVPGESKKLRKYAEMDEAEIKRLILLEEEHEEMLRQRGGWYDCFR